MGKIDKEAFRFPPCYFNDFLEVNPRSVAHLKKIFGTILGYGGESSLLMLILTIILALDLDLLYHDHGMQLHPLNITTPTQLITQQKIKGWRNMCNGLTLVSTMMTFKSMLANTLRY
jgi:hypothetical protein